MRVNGMASGMDIDGMVSKLMKAESVPLDKMKQKQQTLQWQRDDYRDINTSLKDLDTTIFNGLFLQSSFNKKTVTSSNDNLVSASAINATGNMSARIGVGNLATSASWKSTVVLPYPDHPASSDTTLKFTVTDPGNTEGSSTDRVVSIAIAATDTIDNIITKFNSSSLGVTMFKDDTGSLVISNNKTGSEGVIKVDSPFMHDVLGFDVSTTPDANGNYTFNTGTANAIAGVDASITFNGYSMKETSNNFTINGVNYTIKGVTPKDTQGNDIPVNISTATDVDSIYNSIKSFVDKYNDVIKKVNDKISEKRNRDFPPLTDDQRAAMNDTQITQWETKAKSGLLSNDSILSGGLSKMRQDLYSPVSGSNLTTGYTQLSQIGITTSADYSENGKLVIDETTLRQKIQDNPQAIYQLFNSGVSSSDTSGTYSYGTEGLAKRLRDSISNMSSQVTTIAGKTTYTNNQFDIGKQLTDLGTQITDFQSKLTDIENRYYHQFSAMEQAMQQSNQQAAYITQQFSSGG
ncbi:flagellar hook-associated protein 2 [Bacillus sp. EB600]|nr:flagellar hook-associated protein 2 [Bacillus sp. EB600]